MNVLTRYAFISNFNTEKLTKQEADSNGVGSVNFAKCDTNGDGEISIDEILANVEACDSIIKTIQNKIDKLTAEEQAVKSEAQKEEFDPTKSFRLAV